MRVMGDFTTSGCAKLWVSAHFSCPELLARFQRSIPDMYPKAYRWVAEMEEIAEFLGPDEPGAALFQAMAEVFARIAGDQNGDGRLASTLDGVLAGRAELEAAGAARPAGARMGAEPLAQRDIARLVEFADELGRREGDALDRGGIARVGAQIAGPSAAIGSRSRGTGSRRRRRRCPRA